jgi:DNA-binding LacI/PurR family transcriptional regulator
MRTSRLGGLLNRASYAKLPRMPERKRRAFKAQKQEKPIGLKDLADHLGLAPATVSLVLNGAAVADTVAADTRALIFAAAKKFNYRPNFFARCLRTRRSFTVGVIVPEVSEGYNVGVLKGIEDYLVQEGYFYFVASHHFQDDLVEEYSQLFLHRSVDGLIVVCSPWHHNLSCPVATISSHHSVEGVTSIVLDHHKAAELALEHLIKLGHRDIAFIKGQAFVPDTEVRWKAIVEVAAKMNLPINPKLVTQIEQYGPAAPHTGYEVTQKLLAAGERFTALFAFNDVSAMGATRALTEFCLRVPEDVSVLGFDDIQSAAYQGRALTTIRQPLVKMGLIAAQSVLRRVTQSGTKAEREPQHIVVEPELIVRETTAVVRRVDKKSPKALA